VHAIEGRAGKFELATRLQAERSAALHQADDVLVFEYGLPAELLHAFEQLANARFGRVGQRFVGFQVVDEFLVFGADAPFRFGLATVGEVANEIVARLDWTSGRLRNGHR